MITRLRYPKGYQFFDAKGAPLAFGTLSYYVAGTTVLQDTYSDNAGTAVNTNPIALDSSGRLDVDVFLGSTANYKEVLASSSTTVSPWPDDNIPLATQSWPVLISANTSYNIAASGGDYTSLASALSDTGKQVHRRVNVDNPQYCRRHLHGHRPRLTTYQTSLGGLSFRVTPTRKRFQACNRLRVPLGHGALFSTLAM